MFWTFLMHLQWAPYIATLLITDLGIRIDKGTESGRFLVQRLNPRLKVIRRLLLYTREFAQEWDKLSVLRGQDRGCSPGAGIV